ncbi:MAG TPA: cupin domain-containing protein [Burkholderiaceae bacterium]|nr:cupin domain-containing protein [Burkholderiaceae bacterium]
MDLHAPLTLLGGLTPARFMRRHWQREPLLVRAAWPRVVPPLPRDRLFALASDADVESRLVTGGDGRWSVRHGPLPRRSLPPLRQPRWTLLVQGVDLFDDAAHRLLQPFRFVPDARLDDVMISYASDGGGVGPHVDAYDVFLLQLHGRRRWRVGRVRDARLVEGAPLKLLRRFTADHDWLLEPGDMLYLPPGWGHDGVAVGECMTASIGFRAPRSAELAHALLLGVADAIDEASGDDSTLYGDRASAPTDTPARVPPALQSFARQAWQRALRDPQALPRALGQWLSEPKPRVWFELGRRGRAMGARALVLDRRTRMLYDAHHVYINGEALRAAGRDAQCLRRLADARALPAAEVGRLSRGARAIVQQWLTSGWVHER